MFLLQAALQLEDLLGAPRAFAEMKITLAGTTTPTTAYTDAGLSVAHSATITADDEGIFAPVYLDETIEYRMRIVDAGGDFASPLIDVQVNSAASIAAGNLDDGAIEAKLGYTPVAADGSNNITAPLEYNWSPAPSALNDTALGYLGSPTEAKDANYTMVLTDAGKTKVKDDTSTPTWTIPPNSSVAYPIGTRLYFANIGSAGSVTIARGAGVTLTEAGDTTNEDKTLVIGGFVMCQQLATNKWKTMGAGV